MDKYREDAIDDWNNEEMKLYPCDPFKNTECPKTICYLKGGECHSTTHKEYAKDVQEDHN